MKRFATSMVLALAMATLGAAGVAASGPQPNPNAGYAELDCTNGTQVIWVNFVAADLGNGEVPGHVVSGDPGRIFKVISVTGPEGSLTTNFNGAPKLERVDCTDALGYVLTGVFIP
jgi:hypothetical protein